MRLFANAVIFACACVIGCAALTAQDRVEVSTFEGQSDGCIAATPHDQAAIDVCRAGVRAQWCSTWAKRFDAAVCPPFDAGVDR